MFEFILEQLILEKFMVPGKSENGHENFRRFISLRKFFIWSEIEIRVTLMLVTDVGDEICW